MSTDNPMTQTPPPSAIDELFAVLMNGNWSIARRVSASAYGEDTGEEVWSEQGTTAWVGLVGKEDRAINLSRRSLDTADGVELPAHLRFRKDAFELAMALDPSSFAGDISPVDDNTVVGLARTLAIVAGGYDWTAHEDTGQLAACVAGDQGYASTGIFVDAASRTPNTETVVKALQWEEDEPGWWCAQPAAMIGGFGYEVRITDSGNVRARRGRDDWAAFDGTLEEARAAAQADFDQRIRSALASPPAQEAVTDAPEVTTDAAPFKAGDPVTLPGVGECVVQQCFYGVGGWRVIAKGPTSRANPKGLYDFLGAALQLGKEG